MKSIEIAAVEKAQQDWDNEESCRLICGDLSSHSPKLDLDSGLHLCIYKDVASEEDLAFCNFYNKDVKRLLEEFGTPNWAPLSRVPSRSESLSLLQGGTLMTDYVRASIRERNLVNSVQDKWPQPPIVWTRVESQEILLLGGDINKRCGRVDVLDCRNYFWMVSYQYRRSHYPQLPWSISE